MESRQFLDVKVRPRRLAATKDFRGSKYQIYSETEEEIEAAQLEELHFCKDTRNI